MAIASGVSTTEHKSVRETVVDKVVTVPPLSYTDVEFHAHGLDSTNTHVTYTITPLVVWRRYTLVYT